MMVSPKGGTSITDRQDILVSDEGWRALRLPIVGLVLGLLGLSIAYLVTDSAEGQFIVVGPPSGGFSATLEIISEAEGALIATGGLGNVLIAASDRADFPDRLRASGAWLVLPAPKALGCEAPISQGPAV